MLEDYKEKQPLLYNYVSKVIQKRKISHAYLIETNGLDYGFDIALALSKCFLCTNNYLNNKKCNQCNQCKNIDNGNYPDLKIVDAEKKEIKKEQIMQLQEDFSLKPIYGKHLIYIIKNADLLNESSANTILKFLEEPGENIIAILLTKNISRIKDTIVSRCQIISLLNNEDKTGRELFKKYCEEDIETYIKEETKKIFNCYIAFEERKSKVLLDDSLFIEYKDKADVFFSIGLFIYLDVLKKILKIKDLTYKDYEKELELIVEKNTIDGIIKKIDCLNQFLKYNNYNVNKELFFNNFIITFLEDIS